MATKIKATRVLKRYKNLQEVVLDKELASLGDIYVNFVHSLALSQKLQRPIGAKVNNRILAEAVKKSGLRKMLPRRIDRHAQGNAAEALIVYAWLQEIMSFDDCLKILRGGDDPTEAFTRLLQEIGKRLGATHE
ncbi:MAG: ribonuclease III family protein [Candidatus Bathyarchaeia archaeon]